MAYETRHTLNILAKPAALRATQTREIYPPDMYGRAYGLGSDPTAGITFNSPYWSFDPDTDQGIGASIKVPEDRVRGTPVKLYLEFCIPTGPGGGTVMWRLDYLVRGLGWFINVIPAQRHLPTVTKSIFVKTVTAKVEVPGWEVDPQVAVGQPVEFYLGLIRQASHLADTETSAAYLLKVVMEYRSNL